MEVDIEVDANVGSRVNMSNAINKLWIRYISTDIVGKRALKIRVCEISYPTMTSICPPPEKLKTQGGVKKKGKN